ncbi:MAG: nicotinate-nucleotide--dimethylbenzimidazole phosphoribosyltransferase [Clostridia bacterium]|nr:nicotinate-nucleotide--dimethylbenzimidazole phosphoribosyltransferase [Clostridia bacterium]
MWQHIKRRPAGNCNAAQYTYHNKLACTGFSFFKNHRKGEHCFKNYHPAVTDYAIYGHCGDETGHRKVLDVLGAKPLLSLGLRLGEGSGAICAYPIVVSAVKMINEMDSFAAAAVKKYF